MWGGKLDTVRALYLAGKSAEATDIRNSLFREKHPKSYSDTEQKVINLLQKSSYAEFTELLESIDEDITESIIFESRIKSIASIFESQNSLRGDEATIETIRDLLGFRYWIECERFSDFPEMMVSLITQILSKVGTKYELKYIRLFDSSDHPYQMASLHFKVDEILAEVIIMNLMFQSAFSRTLYPMWEGHTKERFDTTDIPFPFKEGEIDYLWGVVCHALINESAILPFPNYSCACEGHCIFRKQFQEIDLEDIRTRVERISTEYGGGFVFE